MIVAGNTQPFASRPITMIAPFPAGGAGAVQWRRTRRAIDSGRPYANVVQLASVWCPWSKTAS
jgi:tripartite-type tricarboxylate transporter receptor subunit TctC